MVFDPGLLLCSRKQKSSPCNFSFLHLCLYAAVLWVPRGLHDTDAVVVLTCLVVDSCKENVLHSIQFYLFQNEVAEFQ